MNIIQLIKRINYKRVFAVLAIIFIFNQISSLKMLSLEIQSEKMHKKICIQEMIPESPVPLEVIR